jgi:hypothetical protein
MAYQRKKDRNARRRKKNEERQKYGKILSFCALLDLPNSNSSRDFHVKTL